MKTLSFISVLIVFASILSSCTQTNSNSNSTIDERVEDLMNQMTWEEKVTILSRSDDLKVPGVERLGIPEIRFVNGPHGLHNDTATCFPAAVAMAASFDKQLLKDVGRVIGEEALATKSHVLVAPTVNLHRIPIAGRNFESYSEDPYLSARMGVNFIDGVQSKKVGTSLKHYALNNQEWERYSVNVKIDERTMHEIYLPAFKAAVLESDPYTIMSSYNRINDTYGSQHTYLLKEILREKWGYD
ncbi:MAG: glycoside hydrolase family 3 N-terminal domain-containing protein, partial [Bacteroidota bacterium]